MFRHVLQNAQADPEQDNGRVSCGSLHGLEGENDRLRKHQLRDECEGVQKQWFSMERGARYDASN